MSLFSQDDLGKKLIAMGLFNADGDGLFDISGAAAGGTSAFGSILTADPAGPADDSAWLVREGVSPAMQVTLRIRVAGVTYDLAAITI